MPITSVENPVPAPMAAIHFIQTASLHIGCLSPGIRLTPGRHTHLFVPWRKMVPSTSITAASSVMSDGAVLTARAILSSMGSISPGNSSAGFRKSGHGRDGKTFETIGLV